jgi:hypothetical protein
MRLAIPCAFAAALVLAVTLVACDADDGSGNSGGDGGTGGTGGSMASGGTGGGGTGGGPGGTGGEPACAGFDLPLDGSCLNPPSCVEFRGGSEESIAGWEEGCRSVYGAQAWQFGPCPSSYTDLGGCHRESGPGGVVEPADPEVGAYWTAYDPNFTAAVCESWHGCWVE